MPANTRPSTASATAALIAGALVLAGHDRALHPLLLPGAAELSARLLVATGRPGVVRALRFGMVRAAFRAVERLVLPGIILHYLARKRALEALMLRACAEEVNGCQQVVVLGAGLDTLAWRLHRAWPAVRWVEVDRAGALRAKAAAWSTEAGENLTLAAADLMRGSIGEAVTTRAGAVDPGWRTLFLAEGLLMYLPLAQVEELFAETARWGPPPARWVFTFFERRPGGAGEIGFRRSSRWVNRWLRRALTYLTAQTLDLFGKGRQTGVLESSIQAPHEHSSGNQRW